MQWEEEGGSVGREAAVWGGWVELGEFLGEDLQEERVKRQLGEEQARSVQRACLREHSQCEWN